MPSPLDKNDPMTASEKRMQHPLSELWTENHGNVLLATLVGILILGASILLYEQNRFVPVEFPSSDSIQSQRSDAASREEPQLVLEVTGAVSDEGVIVVSVYDSADNFQSNGIAIVSQAIRIENKSALVSVPAAQLPSTVAIAAFHDANANGMLDVNDEGIPTERYGFSREAWNGADWPDFADAAFGRPNADYGMTISLK